MNSYKLYCTASILVSVLISYGNAHVFDAQVNLTPQQILSNCNQFYSRAKSYQATYKTEMNLGAGGSMFTKIKIATIYGKKLDFEISPLPGGTGELGKRSTDLNMRIIDNGTDAVLLMHSKKNYLRRKHIPDFKQVTGSYGIIVGDINPRAGIIYSLLPDSEINGHPCYVIESENSKATGGMKTVKLSVDKATFRIIQMLMSGSSGGQPIKVVSSVQSDKVDAPLAATLFSLTIPAGYREIKKIHSSSNAPTNLAPIKK